MKFDKPKKTSDGRYYLRVTNDDDSRVFIQLNNTKLITKFTESNDVTLQLNDVNCEKIRGIDNDNITQAEASSNDWFGKTMPLATLKTAYSGLGDNDTMNVTKATMKGKVITSVFDHTKTPVEHEDLAADTQCDVILEFSGIWFMKKTYGPIWRLVQVKSRPPPKKKTNFSAQYMFTDDDVVEDSSDNESDSDFI